jgi:hypothetical protein
MLLYHGGLSRQCSPKARKVAHEILETLAVLHHVRPDYPIARNDPIDNVMTSRIEALFDLLLCRNRSLGSFEDVFHENIGMRTKPSFGRALKSPFRPPQPAFVTQKFASYPQGGAWCRPQDLNPQPLAYEALALPLC